MTTDAEIRAVLKRPFAEQIAFFRGKLGNLVPTARWDDIKKSAHDRAFMVAGAQNADLLADLFAAVERSIVDGTGLGRFQKDFRAIVKKYGWDYTGEFNWRTRVIYRTNAATSYAAARLVQLREGGFPFWMYKHGGALDPRPHHLAWDGLVLPADHPFWKTHYAPNGWGCSCRVVGLRNRESARALGGDPNKKPPDGWDNIDPATGEPVGIDRGWGYQPGATSDLLAQLQSGAAQLPAPLSIALSAALASPPPPVLTTIDDYVAHGRAMGANLPDPAADPVAYTRAMMVQLRAAVGTQRAALVASSGQGAQQVVAASRLFPDAWTSAADAKGLLFVRGSKARGWMHATTSGGTFTLPNFGVVVNTKPGTAWIVTSPTDLSVAVHEFAHRLQNALPELDELFQALHRRRTKGDPLRRLRDITGLRYKPHEVAREDHYFDPYQGREYTGNQALEVMSVAFETILTVHDFASSYAVSRFLKLYTHDREMFDLTVGLLFGWRP